MVNKIEAIDEHYSSIINSLLNSIEACNKAGLMLNEIDTTNLPKSCFLKHCEINGLLKDFKADLFAQVENGLGLNLSDKNN